jgi:hypothetical protein
MTRRKQPSENEKLVLFVLLFPLLWPFGIFMLIGAAMGAVRDGIVSLYRRLRGHT